MKFRCYTCLMIMLILCFAQQSALGETLITQRVLVDDRNEACQTFRQAYPNVEFTADYEYYSTTETYLDALYKSRFDLFEMSTSTYDCREIMEKGYCANLSESEAVQEALSRMHAPIREQLEYDGRIYGVPTDISFSAFSWCADAFHAAGLSEADVPATYPQLMDFLEAWIKRIKANPENNISINNMFDETLYNKGSYVRYLLEILMDCYVMQCEYAGEPIKFDTPEFRELLERTKTIGKALYDAEPRKKGTMRLFSNTLTCWSFHEIDDGLSHVIPMRITEDQPALIKAQMDILCVGASGGQPVLALAYLENVLNHMDQYARTFVFTDSTPLERSGLESEIADQQTRIDETRRKLKNLKLDDSTRAELENDLSKQTKVLEHMQTDEYRYFISPEWLADYQAHANLLYFPAPGAFGGDTDAGRDMRQLIAEFAEGSVNIDAFIQRMDQMTKLAKTENE